MSGLTLVTITAGNDSLAPSLQAFGDALAQSQWFQTVAAPYGLAAPVASLHVTGAPAINSLLTESEVIAYIQAVIAAGGPQPNGHTLYLLYTPEQGGLASTAGGYHSAFPGQSTTGGDSFAAVQWSLVEPPMTQLDALTLTASHEVLEASTDPAHDGLFIGPASEQPWTDSIWTSYQTGHVETGDLCEGTLTEETAGDAGWTYQRIFSNPLAQAGFEDGGGDPCVPALTTPFYSASIAQDWYPASPGDTLQIPFTGWSSAPTADWLLYSYTVSAAPDLDAGIADPVVATTLGQGAGSLCNPRQALNNGVTGTLTIQMPATAAPGDYGVFALDSFVEGAGSGGCSQPIDQDQHHRWLVGAYVPFPDAGGAPLPPSPTSCEYGAAAFGSDGNLYQICGNDPAWGELGQLEAYSPAAQSWTAAPTISPGPEANFAAVTGPDGRIYVVDGFDGATRWAWLSAFDAQTQAWEQLPSPMVMRDDMAAVTGPDGRIYVIGGWDGTQAIATVEVYDLDAGWSTLPQDLPLPVRFPGVAVGADGRIYVLGGDTVIATNSGVAFADQDAVQIYDLDAGSWSQGTPIPEPWSQGAAIADATGAIYLVGGTSTNQLVTTTYLLAPTSGPTAGWSTVAPLPEPRVGLAGALGPDGRLYVVGGDLGGPQSLATGALNAYSEACSCWTE
jgi:hypothetical protein